MRVALFTDDYRVKFITFRALAIARACHKNPNVADYAARLATRAAKAFYASNVASYATAAARIIRNSYATNAANAINFSNNNDFWFMLQQDILLYQQGNDASNKHLWHGNNNIPDEVTKQVTKWLKYDYNNPKEYWGIWIEFYIHAMRGEDFFNDKVLEELATWKDKQWQRDIFIVNKEIKYIVDKYQQPKDIDESLSTNENIKYQEKDKQANLIKLQDSIKTDDGELLTITDQFLKEIDEFLSSLQSQKPNTDEAMEAWQNTYDFITRLKSHIMLLQETIKAYQNNSDENALAKDSEEYQESFTDNMLDMIDKIGRNKTIQGGTAIGLVGLLSFLYPPAAMFPSAALSYAFLKAQGIEPNILNNIFKSKDK